MFLGGVGYGLSPPFFLCFSGERLGEGKNEQGDFFIRRQKAAHHNHSNVGVSGHIKHMLRFIFILAYCRHFGILKDTGMVYRILQLGYSAVSGKVIRYIQGPPSI